jgi:hypothetical protein
MKRHSLWLFASTAMLSACGDGALTLEGYEAGWLDAYCTQSASCGAYPDKATCLGSNRVVPGQIDVAIAAGKVKFHGDAAKTCLDADVKLASTCPDSLSPTLAILAAMPSTGACAQMFEGTVANGGPCLLAVECASGVCDPTGSSCTGRCCLGTCVAATELPVNGGSCWQPGNYCGEGTICRSVDTPSGPAATCGALLAEGQPCGPGDSCAADLFCFGVNSGMHMGTCAHAAATGSACPDTLDGSAACASRAAFCNLMTTICMPKVPIGGPCPDGSQCVDYADCDPTHTCVARLRRGDACDENGNGPSCLSPLGCTGGVCAFQPPMATCPE